MEITIQWTPRAEKGLNNVLDYLESEWTEREILNLQGNIESFLERIIRQPKIYPATEKHIIPI